MIEIPAEIFGWILLIVVTIGLGFVVLRCFITHESAIESPGQYIPSNHGRLFGSFWLFILVLVWGFVSMILGWWGFV